MKKHQRIKTVSAMLLWALLSLNGCSLNQNEPETEPADAVSLSQEPDTVILSQEPDESAAALPSESAVSKPPSEISVWTGVWNNMNCYLDDPGLLETLEIMAEVEDTTEGKILEKLKAQYHSWLTSMVIAGDSIIVYDRMLENGILSDTPVPITYTYLEEVDRSGYHDEDVKWYVFQTENDMREQFLVFRGVNAEQTGTVLPYIEYFRTDKVERYLPKDTYWTQMFKADTEISSVAAYIINHGRPILSTWGGEWNSLQYDLHEENWEEIYNLLAEEKGCTAEEMKASLKAQYDSDGVAMRNTHNKLCFEEITFTMSSEWVNFPLTETVYAYVGRETTEWETWYIFEAETWETFSSNEGDAKAYPVMLLTKVEEDAESETDRHFHFRYGDNAEELLAMDHWLPTMVDPWHSPQGELELIREHDRSADES